MVKRWWPFLLESYEMKRVSIFIISIIITLSVFTPVLAYANAGVFSACGGGRLTNTKVCQSVSSSSSTLGRNPIVGVIKIVINLVSYATGAASIILITVSAIRLMASRGDANSIKQARNGVLYALVGILVTVTAQVIVVFVLDKFA